MRLNSRDTPHCVLGRTGCAFAGICLALFAAIGCGPDAVAGPLDARATRCSVNNGGRGPSGTLYQAYSGNQYLMSAGRSTMAVPSQPTQGQLLFAVETALPALSGGAEGTVAPLYGCPPGVVETFASSKALIPGTDIYKTSYTGIGFRVFYYASSAGSLTAPVSHVNNYASGVLVFPFDSSYIPGAKARIEVVATGEPISAGRLNTTEIFANTTVTGAGVTLPAALYYVGLYGIVTLSVPTCNVSNPAALNLTLPDATLSALKSGNAGTMTSTTLQVTCSSNSLLAPTLSISGTTVSGYAATLANQDTTTTGAKGVGVKLWVHDTQTGGFRQPTMGLAEKNLGTPVGSLPTSMWSYGVGASYQQVTATPTAGSVSAKATLTLTYS